MIKSILTASVFVTSCIYSLHVQAEPILEKVEAKYIISSYAKTKYPLVFTPGMGAFTRIGTDALGMDYWYQIILYQLVNWFLLLPIFLIWYGRCLQ